ncbi:hypothetical protein B0H17DRAFT_1213216 [Mycena rosella]|uniref:Uncharacterized protein n=1 Tax=Mycena rosella TaxID=1033263 RepID=A0AAD7CRD1_MYCRO|nr:hypothetical protein B0H17DRAFT_1213216 [Mycena rosella]
METPSLGIPAPAAEKCVGAYTGNAAIAQSLSKAGLPYWFVHPAGDSPDETITLVTLRSPESHLELAPHPRYTAISQTTYSTDLKIEAIHKVCLLVQWYNDPFEARNTSAASSSPQAATSALSSQAGTPASSSTASSSQRGSPSKEQRYHPYKSLASAKAPSQPNPAAGRDKFTMLDRPEMPPPASVWATALGMVDQTQGAMCQLSKTDTYYIMPEPALLAAPDGKRGFAAANLAERFPYLLNLASLMWDWPAHLPRVLKKGLERAATQHFRDWEIRAKEEFEHMVAAHYCQTSTTTSDAWLSSPCDSRMNSGHRLVECRRPVGAR